MGIVVTTAAFLGFLVAQLVLGTPHPGESWLELYADPQTFQSALHLSIPITSTSFATDIYIFLLPILGVSKLQMSPRRRFGVLLVFLTGFTFVF